MSGGKTEAKRPRRLKRWGLLDMKSRLWIGFGSEDTPALFDDEELAKLGARVVATRMDWPPERVKAHPFTETRPMRVRDELECTDAGIARARALLTDTPPLPNTPK